MKILDKTECCINFEKFYKKFKKNSQKIWRNYWKMLKKMNGVFEKTVEELWNNFRNTFLTKEGFNTVNLSRIYDTGIQSTIYKKRIWK